MSKGYVIASISVGKPDVYAQYVKAATVAIAKFGGKPLVRGGRCETLEGETRMRNVVLEFDSYDIARAYYHSPEYQAAIKLREGAGLANIVVVEGA